MLPSFLHLNRGWNAEPNAPNVRVIIDGCDVLLRFKVNAFQFSDFKRDDDGVLRFEDCSQYRLGPTNDEGWYLGQCRFSRSAPKWGEFYAVLADPASTDGPDDWVVMGSSSMQDRTHYLFYFRDDTFECLARNCIIEPDDGNSVFRTQKTIPLI
jgi:hypothetical protein